MSEQPADPPGPDAAALLSGRFTEYVDVWERAATRLAKTDYHAEDLLDDWFTLWGKWVRDVTATAALTWRASGADAGPAPDEERESDAG